jgi:cell division protein FtsL
MFLFKNKKLKKKIGKVNRNVTDSNNSEKEVADLKRREKIHKK